MSRPRSRETARELLLHVGYRKTGSSFLQTALAQNATALAGYGIAYPDRFGNRAAFRGHVSSGNGMFLFSSTRQLRSFAGHSLLLSSEKLFDALQDEFHLEHLRRVVQRLDVDRVRVLLLVRDPIEHASSAYQQVVKRGGYTQGVESFFRRYDDPAGVPRLLAGLGGIGIDDVTVLNYSRVRQDLLTCLTGWLRLPGGAITAPGTAVVNRSMTASELAVLRRINVHDRTVAALLADRLCDGLPHLRPDRALPDELEQKRMVERLADSLDAVDQVLPAEHRFDRSVVGAATTVQALSAEQLDVIGDTLGAMAASGARGPRKVLRKVRVVLRHLRTSPHLTRARWRNLSERVRNRHGHRGGARP